MCGEPARAATPNQPASRKESETKAVRVSEQGMFQATAQPSQGHGGGRSIGIGIAVAVVLLVPLFLVIHNRQTSQIIEPAPVASTQTQPTAEEVKPPVRISRNTVKAVHAPAASAPQVEATVPLATNDPAELWKGVRVGNAHAAVTLAKLYLDGTSVPQSCEQTHMLLLAASKKGNKAADDLLTGAYAERCRGNPPR
jgi:hypothetical protein